MPADIEYLAKYPFTKSGISFLRKLRVSLDELLQPERRPVLDAAFIRLEQAAGMKPRSVEKAADYMSDFLSAYVALWMTLYTRSRLLKERLADYESWRFLALSASEPLDSLLQLAREYDVMVNADNGRLQMHFTSYLKLTRRFSAPEWRLGNRELNSGWLSISWHELRRLLGEAVRLWIIDIKREVEWIPEALKRKADEVREHIEENVRSRALRSEKQLPPCVEEIKRAILRGEAVSHQARFTLATYMLSRGASIEDIVELFTSISDYDPNITEYQVMHIAGLKGSRIRYKPPSCKKIKLWGLCPVKGRLCKFIATQ